MKILNYGVGAVGLGLDSFLIQNGVKPALVGRPGTVSALRANGLKRSGIFGDFFASPKNFEAYSAITEVPSQAYDFILVTVKSFDSTIAAKTLAQQKNLYNDQTKIILSQNGWGNAEIFAQYFPQKQIYNARVITGFTRPQPNEVMVTVHADSVHLGSLFHADLKCLQPFSKAIACSGLPCLVVPDIEKDLWSKMLYNCALNPLGAILGVSYGKLGEQSDTRKTMEDIIKEIYNVMKAAGYKTHWATADEYIEVFYEKFLKPTANHRSSTLQALRSGKKVEIDALTGVVVRLAQKYNVPVPINKKIFDEISVIEAAGLKRKAEKTTTSS